MLATTIENSRLFDEMVVVVESEPPSVKHRYGTRLSRHAITRVNYTEPYEEEDMDVGQEPAVNIATEGVDSTPVRVGRRYVDPDPEYTPYVHWPRVLETPAAPVKATKKHTRPIIPQLAIPQSDAPLLNISSSECGASNERYDTERKIIDKGTAFCVVGYQTYEGSVIGSMVVFSNMRDAMLYGEYLVEIGGHELIDFVKKYRNHEGVMDEIVSVFPEDLREEIRDNLFTLYNRMDDYHITVIYDNHKKLQLNHMYYDSFRRELLLEYNIEKLNL